MTALWEGSLVSKATRGKSTGSWEAMRVEIDSRKVKPGDLFVAIQGEKHNGHDYVAQAFESGAVACMVHDASIRVDGTFLLVDNTVRSLGRLAHAARARSTAKIIGVTGSVGKTGTKEMLKLALAAHGKTYATGGNYNNHIGLPLSLVNMPLDTTYGVFEMGMNHAGEIEYLSGLARPHVAIITTVEAVHSEFFESEEAIADAKAEIFEGMEAGGVAIINADNRHAGRLEVAAVHKGLRILRVGSEEACDCRLISADKEIVAQIGGKQIRYRLPALGGHMAVNSLLVLMAVHALGLDVQKSADALGAFEEPEGRGRVRSVQVNGVLITLIDDSYNASPASMRAAFAKTQLLWRREGSRGRKIAVLGDMLELGKHSDALHKELAESLGDFDRVFTAGGRMRQLHDALPSSQKGEHAESAGALLPVLTQALKPEDVVLVKGSHGSRMYELAASLMQGGQETGKKHAV